MAASGSHLHIISELATVSAQFWGTTREIAKRQLRFENTRSMRRNTFIKQVMRSENFLQILAEKDELSANKPGNPDHTASVIDCSLPLTTELR